MSSSAAPWHLTLPVLVVAPTQHPVQPAGVLPLADQDAVVPTAHAELLERQGVLPAAVGLPGLVLAPALDPVHDHCAVVREACEH